MNLEDKISIVKDILKDRKVAIEFFEELGEYAKPFVSLGNQTGFHDVPIVCIETGKTYKSTRDAWRATGVGYSHISECANGKRKTAGGYHWGRM